MDIKKRLINSYSYGGMKEIVRKIIYYYIPESVKLERQEVTTSPMKTGLLSSLNM